MQAAAQGVPAAGESDASARTCVTSGWRSQWPLLSPRTIAHSARRRQGPGDRHEMHYTATFRKCLSPKRGWQSRVLRHVVGHLCVLALDVPVPQMVDQLPDIEQFFRTLSPDPEQVIEVRSWRNSSADCGAARRHSSSWWWRTKFWSSRFFLWTEFNSDAFLKQTHF